MKIRRFRTQVARVSTPEPKPVPAVPARRRASSEPPPRVWSLLLPPGFTNDRR